jgi:thiol-disulfide isomerase/thioredoxin
MPIEYWLAAGAVAGIFIAAALSTQSPLLSIARNIPRDIMAFTRQRTTWAIGALLVAVLGLRPAAAGVRHPPLGREFEVWYAAEPRVAFPVMVDKAPVLIVKFPDYQCPACRAAEEYYAPVFDDLNRQYPNAVRVIRYDFPLGADCNSLVVPGHDAACEAAVAVRLADERGRGPQMEQWLWANQSRFSRESIANAARDIGGATDFDARYDATLTRVRGDVEVGRKIGVRGTPAYFVNGVLLGFVPGINMRTAIVHELQALNLLPRPLPPGR